MRGVCIHGRTAQATPTVNVKPSTTLRVSTTYCSLANCHQVISANDSAVNSQGKLARFNEGYERLCPVCGNSFLLQT